MPTMAASINIIVTCTKRKTVSIPERLKLRHVPPASVSTKARLWQERLNATAAATTSVRELYCGDHWSIAKSMEEASPCRGTSIRIWVASAGYGLIALDDRIKPYSATFSPSHPDSVSINTTGDTWSSTFANWWKLMSQWSGPTMGNPRTISGLVADSPNSPLLVIASENYLTAIKHDLLNAVPLLANLDLLSIFSAGSKSLGPLSKHIVPYDARLQRIVGGALRSLNMRVARKALEDSAGSLPVFPLLRKRFSRLLRTQPKFEQIERESMTDAAVRRFIVKELQRNPHACHSPLLRKFRDGNNACEQKRFAHLYRDIREQMNGTD